MNLTLTDGTQILLDEDIWHLASALKWSPHEREGELSIRSTTDPRHDLRAFVAGHPRPNLYLLNGPRDYRRQSLAPIHRSNGRRYLLLNPETGRPLTLEGVR